MNSSTQDLAAASQRSPRLRRRWLSPLLALLPLALAQAAPAAGQGGAESARGVLRAEHEAVLSSPLSERIVSMPFREGDRFNRGATLVVFDCSRLAAELSAAQTAAVAEARNAEVQGELLQHGATGRADADIARLKVDERRAQAQAIQQRMSGCRVLAPFAGKVVEALVRLSESPPPNEKLIRVVSDGPLELHMVVPSRWLAWLKNGTSFDFKVDETGDLVRATVHRISAAVDPVSQTIKVVCRVPQAPAAVRPGMSGQALVTPASAGAGAKP